MLTTIVCHIVSALIVAIFTPRFRYVQKTGGVNHIGFSDGHEVQKATGTGTTNNIKVISQPLDLLASHLELCES